MIIKIYDKFLLFDKVEGRLVRLRGFLDDWKIFLLIIKEMKILIIRYYEKNLDWIEEVIMNYWILSWKI